MLHSEILLLFETTSTLKTSDFFVTDLGLTLSHIFLNGACPVGWEIKDRLVKTTAAKYKAFD